MSKGPRGSDGCFLNIFLTLAHHPVLLKRFNALGGAFLRFGLLPPAEREAVILRVGARTGCRYEIAQHIPIAREARLDDETILAIVGHTATAELDDRLGLLISVTDEVLAQGTISDGPWSDLAERYEPAALLELVCLIGFYRVTADFLNSVGVELEDDPDL